MVSGASKMLCSPSAISHQSHVAAAVKVKVHAGDVPGLHAAPERLGSVELLATSEPLRSDRSGLPTSRLAEGNPISTYLDTHHLQLPSGTDPPGQLIDDRAAGHDRPAEPLHHGGQARARSGG